MALNQADIIIIPDIHGRDFWKEAVRTNMDKTIVFLGDYLDPYPSEGISNESAWENFMQIVALKKEHMDSVHLLVGNHDLAYIKTNVTCTRKDRVNLDRNHRFFIENLSLFEMAYQTSINGLRYLFTHAGVNRRWLMDYPWFFPLGQFSVNDINQSLQDEDKRESLFLTLSSVSRYRGGSDDAGSMVWADIREFSSLTSSLPNTVQIIGHTQVEQESCINGLVYLLDCREAFVLTQEGSVIRLESCI